MNTKILKIIFFFTLTFTSSLSCKNVYDTDFYHIEIITNNASETKTNEINRIKISSFENILDKILIQDDKNYILENIEYKNHLEKAIKKQPSKFGKKRNNNRKRGEER